MLSFVKGRVICNGVDLAIYHPFPQATARSQLGLPADSFIILFVAYRPRSNRFKDFATAKQALARLTSANGNRRSICLVVLGSAEPGGETVGDATVRYEPFQVHPGRVALYYQASDVFIHAAKAEAFGMTLAEASACGVPVVATAVGGIPEVVKNGETGFLTPAGDAEAMAAAIHQLLADADLRTSMGQAGAADARRRFGLERQVSEFLPWYEEVSIDWKQRGIGRPE
jgi:glycosyltransferase involved in cell wall biosynthesis